jgi:hypothetical protein
MRGRPAAIRPWRALRRALEPDGAAVPLDDRANDEQAQAQAGFVAIGAAVRPSKLLE